VNLNIAGRVPVDLNAGKIQKLFNQSFFSRPFHGTASVSGESEDRKMGKNLLKIKISYLLTWLSKKPK